MQITAGTWHMFRVQAFATGLVVAILSVLPAAASAEDGDIAVVKAAAERFAIPSLRAFAGETGELYKSVDGLCAAPSPAALSKARDRFRDTAVAWAPVSILRIGPILEENRLERLLFWPDRRGVGLRQVQALLQKQDPDAATPSGLAQKSVAVQGLAALEFALFGNGSDELASDPESFRCRFAIAASSNIDGIAGELVSQWQGADGFAEKWIRPAADNPFYRDEKESLSALVNLFSNGLEFYDTMELGSFLGAEPDKDRPKRALFRRSDATLPTLQAGLKGFQDLYETSGLTEILPEASYWIDDSVRLGFRFSIRSIDSLSSTAQEMVSDPEQRSKLVFIRTTVVALTANFGRDMLSALGLTAGFSKLDGD